MHLILVTSAIINGHTRARMRAAMGITKQFIYAVGTLSSSCCCEPKDAGFTSLDDSASGAGANSLSVAETSDTCTCTGRYTGVNSSASAKLR